MLPTGGDTGGVDGVPDGGEGGLELPVVKGILTDGGVGGVLEGADVGLFVVLGGLQSKSML